MLNIGEQNYILCHISQTQNSQKVMLSLQQKIMGIRKSYNTQKHTNIKHTNIKHTNINYQKLSTECVEGNMSVKAGKINNIKHCIM